ncbi:MAG: hypothetical protein OXC30_04470 [Alphaproteobacteria bacterium]|nr:hypothetical protein [Alphaproteobacteria bacterium]
MRNEKQPQWQTMVSKCKEELDALRQLENYEVREDQVARKSA